MGRDNRGIKGEDKQGILGDTLKSMGRKWGENEQMEAD
jgi:hypothetical protein